MNCYIEWWKQNGGYICREDIECDAATAEEALAYLQEYARDVMDDETGAHCMVFDQDDNFLTECFVNM